MFNPVSLNTASGWTHNPLAGKIRIRRQVPLEGNTGTSISAIDQIEVGFSSTKIAPLVAGSIALMRTRANVTEVVDSYQLLTKKTTYQMLTFSPTHAVDSSWYYFLELVIETGTIVTEVNVQWQA